MKKLRFQPKFSINTTVFIHKYYITRVKYGSTLCHMDMSHEPLLLDFSGNAGIPKLYGIPNTSHAVFSTFFLWKNHVIIRKPKSLLNFFSGRSEMLSVNPLLHFVLLDWHLITYLFNHREPYGSCLRTPPPPGVFSKNYPRGSGNRRSNQSVFHIGRTYKPYSIKSTSACGEDFKSASVCGED